MNQTEDRTTTYRAPALDRGLDILELLARTADPLSINAIAAGIGQSRNTIFRMLQVLEERGYICRSADDAGYVLTNHLFMLGMERPQNKGLVEAALPVMHQLADETSQPCHLVVASQEQMVVIARVDAPSDLGFVVRLGHRRPIAHSTSGLVLFAFQPEDVRTRWLAMLEASEIGNAASFSGKDFVEHASLVREQGYANRSSEAVSGVTDLSAPVLQHGAAVGALTIPYVARPAARPNMQAVIEVLQAAAAKVSAALG